MQVTGGLAHRSKSPLTPIPENPGLNFGPEGIPGGYLYLFRAHFGRVWRVEDEVKPPVQIWSF